MSLVLHLESLHETREGAQRARREVFGPVLPREAEQRDATPVPGARQRTVLRCLDAQRVDAGRLRIVTHAVEEHGLADTPQADHEHALGCTASAHTGDGDADGVEQLVATGQLRRGCPRPWGERVRRRVHADDHRRVREVRTMG